MSEISNVVEVNIIGITEPVVDFIPSSEGIVGYAARVSNPNNQHNFDTVGGLLKYCVRNQHWSVFETVNVVMEIKAPRDIARQILRHRSFSFQEFSQRYAKANNFVFRETRLQDDKNRQNSIECDDIKLKLEWIQRQQEVLDTVEKNYQWALDNNIAKECARVVLPEGLTMSSMYMNGTLRSWLHYCDVRCGNGTQKEHIEVAMKCRNILLEQFPFLEEYYKNHKEE